MDDEASHDAVSAEEDARITIILSGLDRVQTSFANATFLQPVTRQ